VYYVSTIEYINTGRGNPKKAGKILFSLVCVLTYLPSGIATGAGQRKEYFLFMGVLHDKKEM